MSKCEICDDKKQIWKGMIGGGDWEPCECTKQRKITMLTFLDFQRKNEERCVKGFNHRLIDWSLMEWCGAATFEMGEAGNKAKKLKRIIQGIKGNKAGETYERLTEDVAKELCDGIIYGFLALSAAGYDAETMIREVFNAKSDEIGSDIKV